MGGCADCCGADPRDAARDPTYARLLWIAVAMNAGMFAVGVGVAAAGGSVSVRADLLDFLGDALATGIGLALLGRSASVRAAASRWQGIALGGLGVFALVSAAARALAGSPPEAIGMTVYGLAGLATNLGVAMMLMRHRRGDAGVRAVWLYSRNDAIGNLAVMVAAGLVAATETRWPDVAAGVAIALLFLHSAREIVRGARREMAETLAAPPH